MMKNLLLSVLMASGLVFLLGLLFASGAGRDVRASQGEPTINLIAIDVVPEGNSATSIGPVDSCVRAERGSDIDVDLVVDLIPEDTPMIAFEMHLFYDPAVVEAVKVDNEFLLGAEGSYQPFVPSPQLADTLPDSDGELRIVVVDLASNAEGHGANTESGPGVLARITLRLKANAVTNLTVGADPPNVYPAIIDLNNEVVQVDHVAAATIAVGEDCPPAATQLRVTPLPDEETVLRALGTEVPSTPVPSTPGSPVTPSAGDDTPVAGVTPAPVDLSPFPPTAGAGTPDLRTPAVWPTATARAALAATEQDDGSDGGTGTVIIIVLASLGGLAAVGGGGWALYRRARGSA